MTQWRKGYVTHQLALVVVEARQAGLSRVMLPVRRGNVGSERAIEKNGGIVGGQSQDPETGEVTLCFWIDLKR